MLHKGNAGDALLELAPLSPTGELAGFVLLWRGECLYRVGRFAEALIAFRQLATLEPENVDAHRWLGAVYFDLGADEAAISELTRVTELDPTDYRPHQVLAILQAESSYIHHPGAIKHYRRALALKPPAEARETLLRGLAKSLIAMRDHRAALDVLGRAEVDAESSALAAECWWVLGDHRRADERLKLARSLDPHQRHLLDVEMQMAQADRKPELVISAATAALERDPHDLEFRNRLAMAYRDLGQLAECERELARAQESTKLRDRLVELNRLAMSDPENAKLRHQLADVCEALGKKDLARMWRRAAAGTAVVPHADRL